MRVISSILKRMGIIYARSNMAAEQWTLTTSMCEIEFKDLKVIRNAKPSNTAPRRSALVMYSSLTLKPMDEFGFLSYLRTP